MYGKVIWLATSTYLFLFFYRFIFAITLCFIYCKCLFNDITWFELNSSMHMANGSIDYCYLIKVFFFSSIDFADPLDCYSVSLIWLGKLVSGYEPKEKVIRIHLVHISFSLKTQPYLESPSIHDTLPTLYLSHQMLKNNEYLNIFHTPPLKKTYLKK